METLSEALRSIPSSRELVSPYLDYIAARREGMNGYKKIFGFIAILVDNSNDTWVLTTRKITNSLEDALSASHFTLKPVIEGDPFGKEAKEEGFFTLSLKKWVIVVGRVPLPDTVKEDQVISMINSILSQT